MRIARRTTALVTTGVAAAALALAMTPAASVATGGSATAMSSAKDLVGLTWDGRQLTRFATGDPSKSWGTVRVRGLDGDGRLVGIDHRVQDGKLYGVGDQGGVYALDARTGAATLVVRLSVALEGTSFGVDFNPAADALRIVSDTGQNLRQSFVQTGGAFAATVVDTSLSYTAGTTATGIGAAGYTNNDLDTDTATTLFVIDTALDQVAIQAPANAGTLSPTGKLGVDVASATGFDVVAVKRGGSTVQVGLLVSGGTLYEVDLLTGDADRLGRAAKGRVMDVTAPFAG
jgi:hypothetical protein